MGVPGVEFLRVDQPAVNRVNDIVIRCSHRFIYSRTRNDAIDDMVQKNAGTSIPGVNAFIGAMPNGKVIEDYMRDKLGLRKRS
jgi:hypothetical protein